jgi:hypothetical protein
LHLFLEHFRCRSIRLFERTTAGLKMPQELPSTPRQRRPFRATGIVISVHQPNVATVRMSNGYETLAHRPPDVSRPILMVGGKIELEFSPADMGHARILPQDD